MSGFSSFNPKSGRLASLNNVQPKYKSLSVWTTAGCGLLSMGLIAGK
jgi:hypothetical protein